MPPVIYPEPGERLPALVRRTLAALPADQRHRVTVVTGGVRYGLDVPDVLTAPDAPPPHTDDHGPADGGIVNSAALKHIGEGGGPIEVLPPSQLPDGLVTASLPQGDDGPEQTEDLPADAKDETPLDPLTAALTAAPTPRKTNSSSAKRRRAKE
ncbi:hypothetical protein [Streptomyces xiamenensis]|uniref:hypothetical protein n=1 Tax=Streptomyces xiamenensis TaxID=408015 RepID=UPI0037D5D78B